jgi:hypothetical protein
VCKQHGVVLQGIQDVSLHGLDFCRVINTDTPHICSENVSKVFAPHPAKRFDPGEHYYLFVDVGTPEQALKAMDTLNGQEGPWGGPLRVQSARGPKEA